MRNELDQEQMVEEAVETDVIGYNEGLLILRGAKDQLTWRE